MIAVGKTAVEEVELCRKVLAQVGGRLLGSVLNLAPSRGLGAVVYGYGAGRYEHGYGEGSSRFRRGRSAAKDEHLPEPETQEPVAPGPNHAATPAKRSGRSKAAS